MMAHDSPAKSSLASKVRIVLAAIPYSIARSLQVLLIAIVKAYRLLLSPWLGNSCRFTPTCSLYAIEALQTHGPGRGSVLAACRIMRCQPWCAGGHDPVPEAGAAKALFTSLISSEKTLP